MKSSLLLMLVFVCITAFGQSDEIYRLAFSDPSNFTITTKLYDRKQPAYLWIVDTTDNWRSTRFWLRELNGNIAGSMKKIEHDEHHPYHHTYLFRDTALSARIPENERRKLSKKAKNLKSVKLKLKGPKYTTVRSVKELTGYYFSTTAPLFSSDGKYGFVDITVYYKETANEDWIASYFGTICIVYERQNKSWKKIDIRSRLIL